MDYLIDNWIQLAGLVIAIIGIFIGCKQYKNKNSNNNISNNSDCNIVIGDQTINKNDK